jgi:uncharacterized FlaG/YvyC family protein
MQVGRLEEIDQSKLNHIEKISKVEVAEAKHKVVPDEKYKNIREQDNKIAKNEVILDNVKFGFDTETKEFFVKISHNGLEQQFPTEQIMKLKAHFKEVLDQLNSNKLDN